MSTNVAFGLQSASPPTDLGKLNSARNAHSAKSVEPSIALDQLAHIYLTELLERRTLTPSGYGSTVERILADDVALALGAEGYRYRYVGVVVAYGQSLNHALDVATGTVANGPALFEPAMDVAGIASGVIPAGDAWYAPPPGGFGRDIEMTGMTIVVIVTAGDFREGS